MVEISPSTKNGIRTALRLVAVAGATTLLVSGYLLGPVSSGILIYGHVFAALTSAIWLGVGRWRIPILLLWTCFHLVSAVHLFGQKIESRPSCGGNPDVSNRVEF